MTPREATKIVLLSGPGRAAIASLLVAGPQATERVDSLFHPASRLPLAAQPLGRILFGRWQSPELGEELIVCRRTGQRVEIHCHGGAAAAEAIVASLVERGCAAVDWRQWVAESSDDRIVAAAQIALAQASTERTAAILFDQSQGALSRAIEQIARQVRVHATSQAIQQIDSLLEFADVGAHLIRPWQVVIAGRPNVGKSSLINALVGYERAIAHPTPGTTRDIVTAVTALDGWPVELSDTAGLHTSADVLETAGMQLARDRLASAELVLLVFDASGPLSAFDRQLAAQWPEALPVCNKIDLAPQDAPLDIPAGALAISALSGQGIDSLERAIAKRLVPCSPASGQAVPFAIEHVETLKEARRALERGQETQAAALLAEGPKWAVAGAR